MGRGRPSLASKGEKSVEELALEKKERNNEARRDKRANGKQALKTSRIHWREEKRHARPTIAEPQPALSDDDVMHAFLSQLIGDADTPLNDEDIGALAAALRAMVEGSDGTAVPMDCREDLLTTHDVCPENSWRTLTDALSTSSSTAACSSSSDQPQPCQRTLKRMAERVAENLKELSKDDIGTFLSHLLRLPIFKDALQTPQARAAVGIDGISAAEASFNKRVMDSLRSLMESSASSRAPFTAGVRRVLAAVVANRAPPCDGVPELSSRAASEATGISIKSLTQAHTELQQKPLADIVMSETEKAKVQSTVFMRDAQRAACFNEWLKSQCIQSSNSKDCKVDPVTKETYVRFIREDTTEQLHHKFSAFLQQHHPEWRIPGLRTFQNIIAATPWVRVVHASDQEICCCVTHSAISFLLETLNIILGEHHTDCQCGEECVACALGLCQRKLSRHEVFKLCVCPFPEGGHPKRECFERTCSNCRDKRVPICKKISEKEDEVTWRAWEKIELQAREEGAKPYTSMEVTTKSGPCSSFCNLLQEQVEACILHYYTTAWVVKQKELLHKYLPLLAAWISQDWSADFKWDSAFVPTCEESKIRAHLCPLVTTVMMESGEAVLLSHLFISVLDKYKDPSAFLYFQLVLNKHLKETYPDLDTIYIEVDNCRCQFKCSKSLHAVLKLGNALKSKRIFLLFSTPHHGKGPSDGAGAAFKGSTGKKLRRAGLKFVSLEALTAELVASGRRDETERVRRLLEKAVKREERAKRKQEKEAAEGSKKKRKNNNKKGCSTSSAPAASTAAASTAAASTAAASTAAASTAAASTAAADVTKPKHMESTFYINYDNMIDRECEHCIEGPAFVATEDSFGVTRNLSQIFCVMFDPMHPTKLFFRNLPCACKFCLAHKYSMCENRDIVSAWTAFQFQGEDGGGEPLQTPEEALLEEEAEVFFQTIKPGDFVAVVGKADPFFPQCYWVMRVTQKQSLQKKLMDPNGMEFEKGTSVISGVYLEYAPGASRKKGTPPSLLREYSDPDREQDYMVGSFSLIGKVALEPVYDEDGTEIPGRWMFANPVEQHEKLKSKSMEQREVLEGMGYM